MFILFSGKKDQPTRGKNPKMTSTYDRVVAVVSKPPSDRTESEADVLMPWFRKKSDLFANLKPGMLISINIFHN